MRYETDNGQIANLTNVVPAFEPDDTDECSALKCLVVVARQHGVHLSVQQLVHENVLPAREVTTAELVKCAESAGLKAKPLQLNWDGLADLGKALPAIVRLKHGGSMVLLRQIDQDSETPRIVLQDPHADEDAALVIDRVRFEDVWTGEVVLIKRDYDIADEEQPFGFGLIRALVFRERWIVRDLAIAAFILAFLALSPILFWRMLTDFVLYYKALGTFAVLCIGFVILLAFETVFAWLRRYLILVLTTRIDVKLSTYVFDKVLKLPIDFFEHTTVGQVTHDINHLRKIQQFLRGQVFGTVLDSTTLIVFIPVMFFFSPLLTAIVLACCAVIALWLVLMLPGYRRRSSAADHADSYRGGFLVQNITGIRTVKSLALDARQRHLWDVQVARVAKRRLAEGMRANTIQSVVLPFEQLAISGTLALGVYFAVTTNDPVYVGALFAFLMLSRRVVQPLVQIAQLVNQYDEARLAVELISKLVNQQSEEGRGDHGVQTPVKGHVEFAGVTFKYKGASSPALEKVSFEVPQGRTLGIMGRSGSGKTTITRLLQRLHSEYEGLIKIDGIDVREYDLDHLRRSVGVVLQENFLFSGTIRENIAAAKIDATFDDVVRAARLAGAEEFIDRLPRGYETYIYEGSPNLSGGQRQRLAIARALIVDPPILILDEATSALDPESEAIINANLARIAQGRTLIVVSHRLGSLVSADSILVLERGKVADLGRHPELLDRCDIYSRLWNEQNAHLTIAIPRKPPVRNPTLVS
ncbi:MAG: peptidase domain-containing ABC transporter [Xanthobacteraceae bacterium]|nr:peptidase domain-containing ABC transporter [Xanthobacteraceae bacterium]